MSNTQLALACWSASLASFAFAYRAASRRDSTAMKAFPPLKKQWPAHHPRITHIVAENSDGNTRVHITEVDNRTTQ